MITGSQELIRDINRSLVLKTIVNFSPISRADLAKQLNLTKATISCIVSDLLKSQLVQEIGSGNTAVGRKPILLAFKQACGYTVLLNAGVTKMTVLISDLKGKNCSVREYPLATRDMPFSLIKDILKKALEEVPDSLYGVIGICIGIYGVVFENEVIFTPYNRLIPRDLGNLLENEFHIPVMIENESNLSVLGESAFHNNYKNMIYINIHDGIGMGILIDGHLYTGHNGYAGEFGHTILFPDGLPCPCGNCGCLEQYASEKAILAEYSRRVNHSSVTIEIFLRAYQLGDPHAIELVDLFVKYMGIAMNNILNTFNAHIIVMNSALTNNIPGLLAKIQASVSTLHHRSYRIVPSRLQDISVLIGGVCLNVEKFLGIDQLLISPNNILE